MFNLKDGWWVIVLEKILNKKYRTDVLLVLALYLIALGIRIAPYQSFPNIYGFDSFWAARQAKYLITGFPDGSSWYPYNDTVTIYPWGRLSHPNEFGWWITEAIVYKIVGGSSTFDYELFGKVASWLTPILGSLSIVGVYFFLRILFGRWAGIAGALFLATSPPNLFYSMFGHAENDALGFSLFFLSLAGFALCIKRKTWWAWGLSALFFAWQALTWQSYVVACFLVSGVVLVHYLANFVISQVRKTKPFYNPQYLFAISSIIPSSITLLLINFRAPAGSFLPMTLLPVSGALLICSLINGIKKPLQKNYYLFVSIALLVLGFSLFGQAFFKAPFGFLGIKLEKQEILDYDIRVGQTIAEQNPISESAAAWKGIEKASFFDVIDFLAKVQGFTILIWLSLISMGIALIRSLQGLTEEKFDKEWDAFIFAYLAISTLTLIERPITLFFLSGVVCVGGAYFFGKVFEYLEKSDKKIRKWVYLTCSILILAISFSQFVIISESSKKSSYDVSPEWFKTFEFLNTVPKGSVVTSWWDYGHWMNYFNGDRIHTTTDNIQFNPSIHNTALSFTHTPPCSMQIQEGYRNIVCDATPEALEKAEIESLAVLKPFKTNYILIDKEIVAGFTGGKWGALTHIANVQVGCIQQLMCYEKIDEVFCPLGIDRYGNYVGLNFTTSEWDELTKAKWPGISLNSKGINSRAFAKKDSSGLNLYLSAVGCGSMFTPHPNPPVLYSFAHRLFFKDQNLKHVKLVYEDNWNVIYEINWTGIPDPQNYTDWTKRAYDDLEKGLKLAGFIK
ncbi:MAG: STT3 domain-containing protein [archaeon]